MNQQKIVEQIAEMQQILHDAQQEVATLPELLQPGAQRIINHGWQHYTEISIAWASAGATTITQAIYDSFSRQLNTAISPPLSLILRRIHCNNLKQLERQRAQLPASLPADALQTLLAPAFANAHQQLAEIEQRQSQGEHEQTLVAILRNNLTMLQEMLAGTRTYAPIAFWNALLNEQQAIALIEEQIAQA